MRHTCSALGLLIVMKAFLLLISLPHVYAYKDGDVMNGNSIAEKESLISAHDQKEVVCAFSISTKMTMEKLGGRKMSNPRKLENKKHKAGSHGGTRPQVFSGRYDSNYNNNGVGGSDERQYIHEEQKKAKKQEPNIQKKSGMLGSPRHNTNTKTKEGQESKATPTKSSWEGPEIHEFQRHDHNIRSHSKQKVEKERVLVEETKEMVSLMQRDYKGVDRARRRPPINNHVPIH